MYLDSNQLLGAFLPQLRTIVEESSPTGLILDRFGNSLPPCIIMEKGEALDLWAKSTGDGLDMITGLQVTIQPCPQPILLNNGCSDFYGRSCLGIT